MNFHPHLLGKICLSLSLKTKKKEKLLCILYIYIYIYCKVCSYTNAKKKKGYRSRTVLFIWKYFFICKSFFFK